MKKILTLATGLMLLAPSATQAKELTAYQIIQKTQTVQGKPFQGLKELTVTRRSRDNAKKTKDYPAKAKIKYINANNYSIKITAPRDIEGIEFHMKNGVNSAYFPDEKLYLFNGGKNTSALPESIILGRITDDPDLLRSNYKLRLLGEDMVRVYPTYVIEITPNNSQLTPRRKFWVDKENFQVLREQRFWANNKGAYDSNAYSQAKYLQYRKDEIKLTPPNPPKDIRRVNLSGKEKNSFLSYSNVADAEEKEKIKILQPNYLPPGFDLKSIQIFTLFGARIQLLNYSDGMNSMLVTIRPQQNFFVSLLAGAFSLNLIQKISTLSFHAPNNYAPRSASKQVGVAFGDVHPNELKKVIASVPMGN